MDAEGGQPPLVYVFIGDVLPEYIAPSLRLTRRFFTGDMIFLTTATTAFSVAGVRVERIDHWYNEAPFSRFLASSPLDGRFRGGFWWAAAERFFVLEQYMTHAHLDRVFHAEADNLVFSLDGVDVALDSAGRGVFYPTDQSGRGFGSLMYCNDPSALSHLTGFMADNGHLGNEMAILGEYLNEVSTKAFALPSAMALSAEAPDQLKRSGVFDAASIGQWLFGIDPSNTVYSTYNRFRNDHSPDPVDTLSWSLSGRRGRLTAQTPTGVRFRVNNLHVHSKIFDRLEKPGVLRFLLAASRWPVAIPVVVRWGHWRGRLFSALMSRNAAVISRPLSRLPGGQAFFRFLAAHSPAPLSNRKRQELAKLLPTNPLRDHTPWSLLEVAASSTKKDLLAVRVWRQGEETNPASKEKRSTPDESWRAVDSLALLSSLLAMPEDVVVMTTDQADSTWLVPGASSTRQVLWPDLEKPNESYPEGPARACAVSFSNSPQPIRLSHLRAMFPTQALASAWAKQVAPEDFVSSLCFSYGNWMMRNSRRRVVLARRSGG